MSEPREFWLESSPLKPPKHRIENDQSLIHVIEFSAYQALEEKLSIATEALEFYAKDSEYVAWLKEDPIYNSLHKTVKENHDLMAKTAREALSKIGG